MGEIYCATDTILGRIVAIKVLDEQYASDPISRKRFTREALAAARLSSDLSTITIFDVGECEGRPFIVMEYLPGGSLDDVLRREGAQPPSRALEWLEQTAQALDNAHERDVVHRDVKPANLLIAGDGRIRVADFGVASAVGLESLTLTGTVIGTAGYLSPEQAEGRTATPASDRYSLGVVGFELLAGSRPFKGRTPAAEAAAHVHNQPPSISARRPEIPRNVDAVFARALAKDPAQRFPTASEFVGALNAAFANAALPTRIIPPSPQEVRPSTDTPRAEIATGKRGWRSRALLLLVPLIAGVGLLVGILLADRGSGSSTVQTAHITVTAEGTTVIRTITQKASPPPTTLRTITQKASPPPTTTTPATSAAVNTTSGSTVALQGYAKMQAGDYTGAIPLLEQAARDLHGSGSLAEAYNDYNLAFSLARTKGCSTRVLQLLDASQTIQGPREPIQDLRKACEKAAH